MRLGWRNDLARLPWRLSARLLIASTVAAVIGLSGICAKVMLDMRRGEEELARQSLENLASSIDADIGRNIEIYDLSLRAVANNMMLPEINDVSRPIRQLILFDRAATAKHFGAIQVFDAEGRLTVDASTLDPQSEDHSEQEYFRVHREQPDFGLYISRPTLHRGAYAIVLSRRITGSDGRFRGVVAGSIRFSYFHDLFGRLNLDTDDFICVLRRDGTIIMRIPFDLDVIGKNVAQLTAMKRALFEPSGWVYAPGALDGVPRLMVWRNDTQPLVVVVGKPWTSILRLWHNQAIRIGALMLALIAFVLAVTRFLARETGRRAEAEEKLEELATTDSLTGLKNRRKFDAEIDREWRRATRSRTPIALLMIDADHFKTYNDTYGHQAGDQVLVGIAICISDSVRRAGDCAARYGGEEFAVLLPGVSPAQALGVAETIRLKVHRWTGEASRFTVSVGVAAITPNDSTDWQQFVRAADKALYAAKNAGRNCCVLTGLTELALAA